MINLVDALVVGVSAFGGSLIGALAVVQRLRADDSSQAATATAYVCGCGHHLAEHDPDTNKCHAKRERFVFDRVTAQDVITSSTCTCRQYVGERPTDWAQLVQSVNLPATRDEERP